MKNFQLPLLLSLPLLCLGLRSANSAAKSPVSPIVGGEFLIGVRPSSARVDRVAGIVNAFGDVAGEQSAIRAFRVRLKRNVSLLYALERIRRHSDVLYVEPNNLMQAAATPNDPSWGNQYGVKKMQVDKAWDYYEPQAQTVVAVLDTGVDYNHPDLASVLYRDANGTVIGYNALNNTTNAADDQGHGTHCAGIIAARINNGQGVAGVAGWNPLMAGSDDFVKIMPVKVLDSASNGSDASVANGIIWAADHGAKVISLSLGGAGSSTTTYNALSYAWNKGCVIVAAAGNSGVSTQFYPAAYPNVISVGATDSNDTMASFSNFGSWVKVAAPGAGIYSTYKGGGYASMNGTSMATPHVAGLAALIRSQSPNLTNSQVSSLILGNVDTYKPYSSRLFGASAGRVNAYRALLAARGVTPPTVSAPSAPTNLQATASSAQVYLTWTASAGATSYSVKRSTTSGSGYSTIANGITGTSYFDFTVTNGKTYYYVVTAQNSAGESGNSVQVSALPNAGTPATPSGLQATAGDRRVALSWSTSSGATSYTVKRSTTSGTGYTAVASGVAGTSYTDTAVSNGTTYYYVVCAANTGGSSADSTQVSASPVAPSTGGGGAGTTTLRIDSGGSGGSSSVGNWSADAYASGGSAYTYPLRDIAGTTDDRLYNSVRYGSRFTYTLPAAAGNYTLRLYFAECWFTVPGRVFNVSVNGNQVLSNFDIVAAVGPNKLTVKEFPVTVTGTNLVVAFQDVKNDAVVSGIELVPAAGTSTPVVTAPAAPAGLEAAASDSQVILNWNASAGAGSYTVKRSTTSGSGYTAVASGLTGTSYTDTTVANGTTYYYVVTASNSGGESGDSAQVSASPVAPLPVAPQAPAGLQASAGNGQVTLSWGASSGATGYNVKRSTTSGSGFAAVSGGLVSGTTYIDTNVANGITYYYVVTAVNDGGESDGSTQVSATPAAPSNSGTSTFRINCGSGAFTAGGVTWSADQYGTGGAKYTYPARDILDTTEDGRYVSVRYSEGTDFTYALPATPGNYILKLHFAECWSKVAGGRIFNVLANGNMLLSNFDIVAEVGPNTAVVKSFSVSAGSNGISVLFQNVKNGPVISGIELVPAP